VKLYSYWRSSSSYRVRIALHLKRIPFEYEAIHLLKDGGAQNAPDYREKNPGRTVPMLEWTDGGELCRLSQSMAIIEYLDELHPEPPLLPRDPLGRARARMLAEIPNSVIQPLQNLVVIRKVKAELHGDGQAWARSWNERGLEALEATARPFAGRYCIGDSLTIADVFLVPQLYSARRLGVEVSRYPTLARVDAACAEHEAFQKAHPDRQPDSPGNDGDARRQIHRPAGHRVDDRDA